MYGSGRSPRRRADPSACAAAKAEARRRRGMAHHKSCLGGRRAFVQGGFVLPFRVRLSYFL